MEINSLSTSPSVSPIAGRVINPATGDNSLVSASPASAPTSVSMRKLKAADAIAAAQRNELAPKKISEVRFEEPSLVATNAKVTTGPGVSYNNYYQHSWLMHFRGSSYIQTDFNMEKDSSKNYALSLNHLSSLVNGKPLSNITIKVNDQVVKTGHNPNNGNYIEENFDITQYLKNGNNKIRLELDSNAFSNYWIQTLSVIEA